MQCRFPLCHRGHRQLPHTSRYSLSFSRVFYSFINPHPHTHTYIYMCCFGLSLLRLCDNFEMFTATQCRLAWIVQHCTVLPHTWNASDTHAALYFMGLYSHYYQHRSRLIYAQRGSGVGWQSDRQWQCHPLLHLLVAGGGEPVPLLGKFAALPDPLPVCLCCVPLDFCIQKVQKQQSENIFKKSKNSISYEIFQRNSFLSLHNVPIYMSSSTTSNHFMAALQLATLYLLLLLCCTLRLLIFEFQLYLLQFSTANYWIILYEGSLISRWDFEFLK